MKQLDHMKLKIRKAEPSDIPNHVSVLEAVADESDSRYAFNEAHAWEHLTNLICNGVCFVAEADHEIVGVLMCGYVDVAFAKTENLETYHWYVLPKARSTKVASLLLQAIETYADERGIVVIFHQTDYHSALNGRANNSRAVERAYKGRGYEGPLDIATVGYEGRRVGVSYRYPHRENVSRPAANNAKPI